MINFQKVTKNYGDVSALLDVSFEIKEGEFVFLAGPSGSGKTTIIRLILREIRPSSGIIKIGDVNITNLKENKIPILRRRLGVIFQDFKLLSDRTVFENVALPLEIIGTSKKEINKSVDQMLETAGLSDRAGLFPTQLSGGELQKTVIARATISKPDLLLADEPTGNLDPETSYQIIKLLKTINQEGTTILMATHNANIVDRMNKRVIYLKKGKLIKDEKTSKYPHSLHD